MLPTYPAGDLDQPSVILAYLGTFWSWSYDGGSRLRAYSDGLGRATQGSLDHLNQAADCLCVDTVPLLRDDDWAMALLPTMPVPDPRFYGSGHYGDGGSYGDVSASSQVSLPLPGYGRVGLIQDAVINPAVLLLEGLDYLYDGENLSFLVDPSTVPLWTRPMAFDGLTAWLYRPGVERRLVGDHFGYVLGLDRLSSPGFKQLVVALWDSLVLGPSVSILNRVLAAITGSPVVQQDGEVVMAIERDGRGLFVATDQAVYRAPAGAEAVVAIGDSLLAGDPLTDGIEVLDLGRGSDTIAPGTLPGLALPRGLLQAGFLSDLVVEDRDSPLVVGTNPQGKTTARFAVSGFPADIALFWELTENAGFAPGATSMARLLDVRGPAALTEPTAASLPVTLNALRFVLDNVLRGSTVLIKVKAGSLPGGTTGLADLSLLRRVIPPTVLVLVLVDLPALLELPVTPGADLVSIGPAFPPILEPAASQADQPGLPRILSRVCR